MDAIIAAYTTLTSSIGFGEKSSTQLRRAGATWEQIHAWTDAGLIRPIRCTAGHEDVVYRMFFP
jgi:hypothetical protein